MPCEEFQEDLSASIDGELDATAQARLEAHLQTCPDCSALLKEFHGGSSLMHGLEAVQAPVFVTDAAMGEVARMRRVAAKTTDPWTSLIPWLRQLFFEPFFPKAAMAAAAFAALLVVAVLIGQQPGRETYNLASVPNTAGQAADPTTPGYDFRDAKNHGRRDAAAFSDRERLAWKRGMWRHENRFGRDGSWWQVSGAWYWYEQSQDGPPAYASAIRFADLPPAPPGH